MICVELKQLYTAITRPRNRLIIVDQVDAKANPRAQLEKYWKRLGVVENIEGESFSEVMTALGETQLKENLRIFQSILTRTSKQEWRKQGQVMMRQKFFE